MEITDKSLQRGWRVKLYVSDYEGTYTIKSEVFNSYPAATTCKEYYEGLAKHLDSHGVAIEDIIIKDEFCSKPVMFDIDGWMDMDSYEECWTIEDGYFDVELETCETEEFEDVDVDEDRITYNATLMAVSSDEAVKRMRTAIDAAVSDWRANR